MARPTPIALAVQLRERGHIRGTASEDDLRELVTADGMDVVDRWGFRSRRLRAMHVDGTIYLSHRLDRGWRLALTAHEYGHAVMHPGNHLYLAVPQLVHLRNRQEREAQVFAGTLLLGYPFRPGFDDVLSEAHNEGGIPADFLFGFMHAAVYRG